MGNAGVKLSGCRLMEVSVEGAWKGFLVVDRRVVVLVSFGLAL
jgi:hypothetical protein